VIEQWSIGVSDHRAFGELHRLVICPIQRLSWRNANRHLHETAHFVQRHGRPIRDMSCGESWWQVFAGQGPAYRDPDNSIRARRFKTARTPSCRSRRHQEAKRTALSPEPKSRAKKSHEDVQCLLAVLAGSGMPRQSWQSPPRRKSCWQ
jgi:hypothetical protein